MARVDSGVGKEEWVAVQRKKKPSGGEGRVRMLQATFDHYLTQSTLLAQSLAWNWESEII